MVSGNLGRNILLITALVSFICVAYTYGRGPLVGVAPSVTRDDPATGVLSVDSVYDPPVMWPTLCGCQQTGKINTTITGDGLIGVNSVNPAQYGWPSSNFEVPAYSEIEYLWMGAIWIGGIVGEDTLVSTAHDGWMYTGRELYPLGGRQSPSVTKFDYPTDFSMRAVFTDTITEGVDPDYSGAPYRPLGLRISNRSHVRRYDPYRDVVLYDLVITNVGGNDIEKGCFGMYMDPDVYKTSNSSGWADDLAGSLRSSGIAYAVDNNGDPVDGVYEDSVSTSRAVAFCFLSTSFEATDTSFNWWVNNNVASYDFGPRQLGTPEAPVRYFDSTNTATGNPVGNANQYYVLSFREWDYDQCRVASILPIDTQWLYPENRPLAYDLCDGYDTRMMMSIGPFDLAPDSSVRLQFAMLTADSIHTDPDIMQYLPYYPSAYAAMLGVERLVPVSEVARQFGSELLDPMLPPVGFEIRYGSVDSVVYEWDPWVFGDVTDYRLLLGTANPADLPHPGVIPPWQVDIAMDSSISTGLAYRYSITNINPHLIYVARLQHVTSDGEGQSSPPVSIHVGGRPAAPAMVEYSFAVEGDPLALKWTAPPDVEIDHYNIYKFTDSAAATKRYLPFYDTRELTGDTVPRETITVDGKTFYYYALETYATVQGGDNTFVDDAEEGNTYVVTTVDRYGFESEMSSVTIACIAPPRNRDVLVLTRSSGSSLAISSFASIEAFYDSVFAGTGLDYEIYDIKSNCVSIRTCPDWRVFLAFRWVIVDDVIYDGIPYMEYEISLKGFCRYMLSGGNLAYFGAAFDSWSWISLRTPPVVMGVDDGTFIKRFFGLDSLSYAGATYAYPEPVNDSLFGFTCAEAAADLPGLRCRTEAYPLGPDWERFWPLTSPPSVTTYWPDDRAVVTHRYSSQYPLTSLIEAGAVGLRTSTVATDTYLFGFHLYYMRVADARGLLVSMMTGNCPPVLSVTGEEHFDIDAVYPDTGSSSTVFTFKVRYEDPEDDPPISGYPRVYIHSAQGCATGSPFVMSAVEKRTPPGGNIYSVDVTGLLPGSYTYRIEARDTSYALAGGKASAEMAGPFVRGDIRHVAVDGSDVTGDGSEGAPFGSIQHAVDASINGDAVVVHDGEYTGAGNRDISFGGKGVIVRSLHGASVTTIDVQGSEAEPHRVFEFGSGEGVSAVVEGFTITGGYSETGAGAHIVNSSPTFRQCLFAGNVASTGPAVAVYDGSVILENCTVVGNVADSGGCFVCAGNSPRSGATLEKCIIAFTVGASAVVCDGDSCNVAIANCDIYQNERGDWVGCIAGTDGISGNFSSDPMFCDTSLGNYGLRGGSPCLGDGNEGGVLIGALGLSCVPTSVGDDLDSGALAHTFSVSQNFPNPFNASTSISFSIPEACQVTVAVYNVLGQQVATVLDAVRPAGSYVVTWDGTGHGGAEAASGVYFYRVSAGAFVETRKMLLVK